MASPSMTETDLAALRDDVCTDNYGCSMPKPPYMMIAERRAAADEIESLLRQAATWDDDYNRLVKSDAAAIAEANARADTAEQRLAGAKWALTTIAGPPERDPDDPPIYQPRWSACQCRDIARDTLAKIGETNDRG